MKLLTLTLLLSFLGMTLACDRRGADRDDIQREEAIEEAGHEMDELGDEVEDAVD